MLKLIHYPLSSCLDCTCNSPILGLLRSMPDCKSCEVKVQLLRTHHELVDPLGKAITQLKDGRTVEDRETYRARIRIIQIYSVRELNSVGVTAAFTDI